MRPTSTRLAFLKNQKIRSILLVILLVAPLAISSSAQENVGKLLEFQFTSPSLQGNLLGDPALQHVAIYLPPSYDSPPKRRYAAVYLLHGYTSKLQDWTENGYQGMSLLPVMDGLERQGTVPEMIVVVPNGDNAYFGSFYTNSPVTGNWEDYIYRDLVSYVDSHFRTIPDPASRGIAGHSMGGYGAIMMGMKHPDVFGAFYALSPCCVALEGDAGSDNPVWAKAAKVTSRDIFNKKPETYDDFWTNVMVALSAAFSPDVKKGPLFVDYPFKEVNGRLLPNEPAYSEYRAKMPLYLVEKYRENLLKLRGIALDVGEVDDFSHIRIGSREFSEALSSRGIPHSFEIYKNGDHGNKIRERFEKYVIPFFSRTLEFGPEPARE